MRTCRWSGTAALTRYTCQPTPVGGTPWSTRCSTIIRLVPAGLYPGVVIGVVLPVVQHISAILAGRKLDLRVRRGADRPSRPGRFADMTPHDMVGAALSAAEAGLAAGELPIGAVVVMGDEVVGWAYTQDSSRNRRLVHADLLAMITADERLG